MIQDLSVMQRGAPGDYMGLPEQSQMCSPYLKGHLRWEGPSEMAPLSHNSLLAPS